LEDEGKKEGRKEGRRRRRRLKVNDFKSSQHIPMVLFQ
jgi:hypothetical protein